MFVDMGRKQAELTPEVKNLLVELYRRQGKRISHFADLPHIPRSTVSYVIKNINKRGVQNM